MWCALTSSTGITKAASRTHIIIRVGWCRVKWTTAHKKRGKKVATKRHTIEAAIRDSFHIWFNQFNTLNMSPTFPPLPACSALFRHCLADSLNALMCDVPKTKEEGKRKGTHTNAPTILCNACKLVTECFLPWIGTIPSSTLRSVKKSF